MEYIVIFFKIVIGLSYLILSVGFFQKKMLPLLVAKEKLIPEPVKQAVKPKTVTFKAPTLSPNKKLEKWKEEQRKKIDKKQTIYS